MRKHAMRIVFQVIIEMVRRRIYGKPSISEMLSKLPEPLESREYRLKIKVGLREGDCSVMTGSNPFCLSRPLPPSVCSPAWPF